MTATLATAPAATKPLLCPFDLSVDFIDRMLNFEIADDPLFSASRYSFVRVVFAATAGTVVFVTIRSAIWLIVALLGTGVVVNAVSRQGAGHGGFDHPSGRR
jgi:hypothetical protein